MNMEARFDLSNNILHLQKYSISLSLKQFQSIACSQYKIIAFYVSVGTFSDSEANLFMTSAIIIDESVLISIIPPIFSIYSNIDKYNIIDYYQNLIYKHYADIFVDKLPMQLSPLYVINYRISVKIKKS